MSAVGNKDDIVVNVPEQKAPGWVQEPTPVDQSKEPAAASNLEIEIVDDTPEKDRNRPPRDPKVPRGDISDDEIKRYSESSQKRIKQLRYEYHEERRQKEASQRQAEEAIRVAQHWQQENHRLAYIAQGRLAAMTEQARNRSDNEITLAQKALGAAIETGKSDEISAAQTALTRAVTQREMMPARPAAPPQQAQQQYQQDPRYVPQAQNQQQYQQPSRAETTAPDPKAVKWLKDNQWFGSDKRMTGFAYGVHEELVTEKGIDPIRDADEYYGEVNAAMRKAFPDEFEDGEPARAQAARPNIVSPPARGAAPRKVQLTASQATVAKRLGLTLEQYANQLIKEQKANG